MKYIGLTLMCLICTSAFSQLPGNNSLKAPTTTIDIISTPWKIERLKKENSAATHVLPDSAAGKKIVIRYTSNSKGKVIAVSYLSKESTSSEEVLINDAKIKTLMAKPVIQTHEGVRYVGSYTYCYTAKGKLLWYFQNRGDNLIAFNDGLPIYCSLVSIH